MIRHPARYYIHYLFSKRLLKNEAILRHLDDLCFPLPHDLVEIERFVRTLVLARKRSTPPTGFDPNADPPDSVTSLYLSRMKIKDIWTKDPSVQHAIDLLNEPLVRRAMEVMLLGPLTPMTIAARIRNRYGFKEEVINTRVVRAYMHYFWNPGVMSVPEWKNLLYGSRGKEDISDYIMALTAPRTEAGAAMVMAYADRDGTSLPTIVQYSAIKEHAFGMFMGHALLQRPSMDRTVGAFQAFQMFRSADEELTKRQGGSAELLEEFRRIEQMHDDEPMLEASQLPSMSSARVIDVEAVEVTNQEVKP